MPKQQFFVFARNWVFICGRNTCLVFENLSFKNVTESISPKTTQKKANLNQQFQWDWNDKAILTTETEFCHFQGSFITSFHVKLLAHWLSYTHIFSGPHYLLPIPKHALFFFTRTIKTSFQDSIAESEIYFSTSSKQFHFNNLPH